MKTDYMEECRRSVRRDFARNARSPREQRTKDGRRVTWVGPTSSYFGQRSFFLGREVREVGGGWVRFVNDEDSDRLNAANGWSSQKRTYLLAPYRLTND